MNTDQQEIDKAWDILRAICDATNNDNWSKVVEIFYAHRNELRSEHYDALTIGLTLSVDFVKEHRKFVSDVISDVKKNNIQFDSFRVAYRFALFESIFEEYGNPDQEQIKKGGKE